MSLRRRCAIEQTVHKLNLVEVGCRDDVLRALLSGPVTASTQTEEHHALLDPETAICSGHPESVHCSRVEPQVASGPRARSLSGPCGSGGRWRSGQRVRPL